MCHGVYTGNLVSSTNKTNPHDIPEIVLKVALNTINLNQTIKSLNTKKTTMTHGVENPKIYAPSTSEEGAYIF
jgi:hypothetical protein